MKKFTKPIAKVAVVAVFVAILITVLSVSVQAAAPQLEFKNDKGVIDFSKTADTGTVSIKLAKAAPGQSFKVQVSKGDASYNYDLKNDGSVELYPLQMGSGDYTVRILVQNPENGKYAMLLPSTYKYDPKNDNAVFLNPNQYVNYNKDSKIVAKAAELTKDSQTESQKVTAIYNYVIENLTYDFDKAKAVMEGKITSYVPSVDLILDAKKGICFDYAAVFAAMLRSVGIPAKLVIGKAPNNPSDLTSMGDHAWNEFFLKDKGWYKINEMQLDTKENTFNFTDPTMMSAGGGSAKTLAEAAKFIGNGERYTGQREY